MSQSPQRRVALIQIVSEQTLQNVLPAMAIPAARVVMLYTVKVAGRMQPIENAIRAAGVTCEFVRHRLPDLMTVREMTAFARREVSDLRKAAFYPIVNFTGGTKIMSAGAYAAAILEKVPSLYVDTEHERFLDGETAPGLSDLLPAEGFSVITSKLTVDLIALANGARLTDGSRDWRPFLPLAKIVQAHEADCWAVFFGREGFFPGGDMKGPSRHARQPVRLPEDVAREAIRAGILVADGAGAQLPQQTQKIEQAAAFFTGVWWEVLVANWLDSSGRYSDIRWSVTAQAGTRMEEDVLAVEGVQLLYVCCKRGGAKAKLSRLLEEIDASARRLGGAFVRKLLAVYMPPTGLLYKNLERRARQLGIQIVTGSEILGAEEKRP